MSKYTTEVRYICETYAGLKKSADGDSVDTIITNSLPHIFNFDFPIFDESYRTLLEKKIILHYYTREIGYETVGLWKLKLNTKLNEIMPYYNKLYESELLEFNPLYSHDIKKKKDNTTTDSRTETLNTNHNKTTSQNISIRDIPNETTYNLHSDTPQGGLTGLDNNTYLSDADKITRTGDSTKTNTGSGTENLQDRGTIQNEAETVDDYLEHIYGYEGYSPNKLLKEYRDNFLNIDLMIINDLNKLFMGIW